LRSTTWSADARSGSGGQGRTAADLDRFFLALGPQKTARIRLAVMDMWKAYSNSVQAHAPQAQILPDKFHILRHLAVAMDQLRRARYVRQPPMAVISSAPSIA